MNEPNVLTTILSAWEANNSESHKVEGDKHPLVFVGGGFLFTWVKKGQNSSFQKICWHYFWWGFKTQLVFSGASDTFNVSPRSPGSFLQNYCLRHWGNLTNSFRKEVQQKNAQLGQNVMTANKPSPILTIGLRILCLTRQWCVRTVLRKFLHPKVERGAWEDPQRISSKLRFFILFLVNISWIACFHYPTGRVDAVLSPKKPGLKREMIFLNSKL